MQRQLRIVHTPFCALGPTQIAFRFNHRLQTNQVNIHNRTHAPHNSNRLVVYSMQDKTVWIKTSNKSVVTTSLETGVTSTFVFDSSTQPLIKTWEALGRFTSLLQHEDGSIEDISTSQQVATLRQLSTAADLSAFEAETKSKSGLFIMAPTDWQIIPAENLVAAFQSRNDASLLAQADTFENARIMLEALEIGTDGVLFSTDDPTQVRSLAKYIETRRSETQGAAHSYDTAQVVTVRPVGMGDRACVDLCSVMVPGEGLLVGSFAKGLFLVHSECSESSYINSRPFRVNAGPVHAYLLAPEGRTVYLSELRSGHEALIVDPQGRQRSAIVGRVKIEQRPLVLIEAKTSDGEVHSILLQNAETVKLVGPAAAGNGPGGVCTDWEAIAVSQLNVGDTVYVLRQGAARHTGVAIKERITER